MERHYSQYTLIMWTKIWPREGHCPPAQLFNLYIKNINTKYYRDCFNFLCLLDLYPSSLDIKGIILWFKRPRWTKSSLIGRWQTVTKGGMPMIMETQPLLQLWSVDLLTQTKVSDFIFWGSLYLVLYGNWSLHTFH